MQRPHITVKLQSLIDELESNIEKAANARQDFAQTSKSTESLLNTMSRWLLAMRINASLVDYDIAKVLKPRNMINLDQSCHESVSSQGVTLANDMLIESDSQNLDIVPADPEEIVRQLADKSRLKRPTRISRLIKKHKST